VLSARSIGIDLGISFGKLMILTTLKEMMRRHGGMGFDSVKPYAQASVQYLACMHMIVQIIAAT
jgi:hypothetical protein